MNDSILTCHQLTKQFDQFTAVDQLEFSVEQGSFFSILGPSGCGKTTLLRLLAGFEQPSHGEIYVNGRSMQGVAPNQRPINMVFQHLALFPNMSVAENIAYGLKRRGLNRTDREHKVIEMLKRISLPDSGQKKIHQLSGGQKQRVALARCLVLEPQLLLLDEPLGALDLKLREKMKLELKQLQREFGTTFVYITHDQSEALVMSDQVAVMNHGRFEQIGSPKSLYLQPETGFVARFVGQTNAISGTLLEQSGNQVTVESQTGERYTGLSELKLSIGQSVELFIRPEALHLEALDDTNQLKVALSQQVFDGANSSLILDTPHGEFHAHLPPNRAVPKGSLELSWHTRDAVVLPQSRDREGME